MSNMWLYQISAERWPIGQWRDEMWEGYKNRCRAGRMVGSKDEIEDGDIIVFWYTKTAAKKEESNLYPLFIECAGAYATEGEICDVLREVFGEYEPATIF